MLTYDDFISELESALLPQAREMLKQPPKELSDAGAFRQWRHQLEVLMSRVSSPSRGPEIDLSGRRFKAVGGYSHEPSLEEHRKRFQRDLEDTIFEIETEIRVERAYGESAKQAATAMPAQVSTSQPSAPIQKPVLVALAVPEKVTLKWLFTHVSVSIWVTLGGLLFAAFSGGMVVGRSRFAQLVVDSVTTPATERAAVVPQVSSPTSPMATSSSKPTAKTAP